MTTDNRNLLRIGQLAAESGVPIKTIRYYEDLGLLHPLRRTQGGFRLFSPSSITHLNLIKASQHLGLNLQEVKQLIQIYERKNCSCEADRLRLKAIIQAASDRVKQLESLKTELIMILYQNGYYFS